MAKLVAEKNVRKRVVVPRGGSAWTRLSVVQSRARRMRWPALLASLGIHGAVLAAVGVAAERYMSSNTSDGYEVAVLSVDEVPLQADLEKIFAAEKTAIEAMEIGEPAEPSAAAEVAAVARAVLPPNIPEPVAAVDHSGPGPIIIHGLDDVPEPAVDQTTVVATAPAVESPTAQADATGYWMGVRGKIFEHLIYPRLRRGQSADTNILLRVTIDGGGRLVEAVADSAPSPFTLAAVRAVERAAPFDAPASGIPLTMELPVEFRSKNF